MHPFLGSEEVIHNKERYCLWIEDADLDEALAVPSIAKRIEGVRQMRLASKDKRVNAMAARAHQMREMNRALHHTIAVPRVSSENREYLPVALLEVNKIVGDSAFALYDAPIWCLALLASRMHWVWIGVVCSRLRTDFRYSNTLGWNTVPDLTDLQKDELTYHAEAILVAREASFPKTIAQLYKPQDMPEELREAHQRNDDMIERIYRDRPSRSDSDRLEYLFKRYAAQTRTSARP